MGEYLPQGARYDAKRSIYDAAKNVTITELCRRGASLRWMAMVGPWFFIRQHCVGYCKGFESHLNTLPSLSLSLEGLMARNREQSSWRFGRKNSAFFQEELHECVLLNLRHPRLQNNMRKLIHRLLLLTLAVETVCPGTCTMLWRAIF